MGSEMCIRDSPYRMFRHGRLEGSDQIGSQAIFVVAGVIDGPFYVVSFHQNNLIGDAPVKGR